MNWYRRNYREFLRDERGAAAGFEFAMFIPLMFGILVFAAEYANALMTKEAFESAVRDATRVLSRASVIDCDPSTPQIEPCIEPFFLNLSRDMVAARVGLPLDRIYFEAAPVVIDVADPGLEFRSDYILVAVDAGAALDLPLLAFINSWTGRAQVAREEVEVVDYFFNVAEAKGGGSVPRVDVEKGDASDLERVDELLIITAKDTARWVGENRPGCEIGKPLSCGGPN